VPPWVASGGRDPDNARIGIVERTVIGVNNVYFDIATSLKDQFWTRHNATDVINHAIAENYRLHGVTPLRGDGYLPEAWLTRVRAAQIVVAPPRPGEGSDAAGSAVLFDRLETPPNRGQWVVESGLLLANERLTGIVPEARQDLAMLLIHRRSPGVSGEVGALLTLLGEWDKDRRAMMKAARGVLSCTFDNMPLALAVMPDLKRFLPHEAHPLPAQHQIDRVDQAEVQRLMPHVDVGSYLPASVRLAKHDEDTQPKKGTYRG
jgi:hypothetical protein